MRTQRRIAAAAAAVLLLSGMLSAYLGCYTDHFAPFERDLDGMVVLEEGRISPSFCESVCGARHGYKYFGLQFGAECWCGNSFGKYGQEHDESKCAKPCSGDASLKCGGELLNSVYEITSPFVPPAPHRDGRPLIGLVMIVKNESHTLPATLLAIKPWIDVYYILDTGSTDGTQDAIRRTLGKDKGEVWEEPFIDYGRSRNRALEIAQTTKNLGGPPIFSLMLSADETVNNGEGLRKFCEAHRDLVAPNEEAYYVTMDVGWRFDSARLSRTDKGWRYKGRVHEYLADPAGRGSPTLRVPGTYIKFKVTDPERRSAREYTILKILQEEVAEKPRDTRAAFYLARTYNVIGNHSAALAQFQRRVSLGGWKEEVYESLYAIAWQKDSLHHSWAEVQQAFLDAHNHSPERAEPLYAIASHWYKTQQPHLAYLFAAHAATIGYPTKASLWVQADVYAWQCWMVMGMTGLSVGRDREGAEAILRALLKKPADAAMNKEANKYRVKLGSVYDELECKVDPTHCRAKQAARSPIGVTSHSAAGAASDTDPAHLASNQIGQLPAGGHHEYGGYDESASNVALHYAIIALLLVTNVATLLWIRKGKAAAACMPSGLGLAMGIGGNEKQV